ncbi:MAG: PQQ-dependent sugar dehydrogenase [Planctomycetota bacterium]
MNRMLSACCAIVCALTAGSAMGQFRLERIAQVSRPVFMTSAPGEPDKLFVVEQLGRIRIIENDSLVIQPFLDINPAVTGGSSGADERGLLGLAFSPGYAEDGRFFVYYTGNTTEFGLSTVVAEYSRDPSDPTGRTALTTETRLLTFDQPFSNHNGGWMGFGPDGFLYISTGDGGSFNDPGNRSSNLNVLQGKMLRLDVSQPGTYSVPGDNPFVGATGLDEIWAYGLRNPWRSSFDRETGDLWIADVGQGAREEVNFQPVSSSGGEHYGWRCREGMIETPAFPGCTPNPNNFVDPVYDYASVGSRCSVTGGYVYRGCLNPDLEGNYIFGDYCSGEVFSRDPATGAVSVIFNFGFGLSSFGEDADGELYLADVFAGTIDRLEPTTIVDDNENGVADSCEICPADVNADGDVTDSDFFAWVTAFTATPPTPETVEACDVNLDSNCDDSDFFAWVTFFTAGGC